MSNVPWFAPGVLVSAAVAVVMAVPVGRALPLRPAAAGVLVLSFGIVISATMTPLRLALEAGAVGTGICDFSRLGIAPFAELDGLNDTTLNILLFVPLGLTLCFVPWSWRKAGLLFASMAFPFVIEIFQLLVSSLARGCQSADVADNLTGLFVGLAIGTASRLIVRGSGQQPRAPGHSRYRGPSP